MDCKSENNNYYSMALNALKSRTTALCVCEGISSKINALAWLPFQLMHQLDYNVLFALG